MNELVNTETRENLPARLDDLAKQAHMFVQGACMNLLQLGRVLSEVRRLIPHGQFGGWCREHAKMSARTAEQYMQAYEEFGLDSRIAELGTSKVLKLLPMTEDERRKLLEENDVAAMTTRQLDAAIREQREQLLAEARAEAQAEIDAARAAQQDAERRAEAAEKRPPEVPEELVDQLRASGDEIERYKAEVTRLAALGQDSLAEQQRLARENATLKRDIQERDEDLEALQMEYDRAQADLLNMQSQIARGDAERVPSDELDAAAFSAAVRQFLGACARMPYMSSSFSLMATAEKREYEKGLQYIESWARDSRRALNTTGIDEAVIIDG